CMRFRAGLLLVFATPGLLLLIAGAFGQQRGAEPRADAAQKKKQPQPKETKVAEQQFPPGGPMETSWKVEWDTVGGYGLVVKGAWYKRSPKHDWMQVLGDARVSEIFVPYHKGTPRFWDVSYNFDLCTMTRADAGANGKLHVSHTGSAEAARVVEELRHRGLIR